MSFGGECTDLDGEFSEFSTIITIRNIDASELLIDCYFRSLWAMPIFTTLRLMQGGLVARKMSVRLSVKRVYCDQMEEKSVQIFIPYERSFSLVF